VIHAVGWQRRPAHMTKPLSSDLRERLIEAVAAGMSRRAAADRFGIAASTAVKWVRRWRDTGSKVPRPQGGDKRSQRIEAHAEEILGLIATTGDITLSEIASHLARRHGERFAQSTVWRFLDRHSMTFKKNRSRQRAGAAGRRRAKTILAHRSGRA
jgi:transposase